MPTISDWWPSPALCHCSATRRCSSRGFASSKKWAPDGGLGEASVGLALAKDVEVATGAELVEVAARAGQERNRWSTASRISRSGDERCCVAASSRGRVMRARPGSAGGCGGVGAAKQRRWMRRRGLCGCGRPCGDLRCVRCCAVLCGLPIWVMVCQSRVGRFAECKIWHRQTRPLPSALIWRSANVFF